MRWTTLLIASGFLLNAAGAYGTASADERLNEKTVQTSSDDALIGRLARYYRIQNYEMNRLDRAQYDRRSNELQQRMEAWEDSGRNAEQTRALLEWLNVSVGGVFQPTGRRTSPPMETLPAPIAAPSPSLLPEVASPLGGGRPADTVKPEIQLPAVPLPEDPTLPNAVDQGSTATPEAPQLSATDNQSAENSILSGIHSTIDDLVKRVEQVAPISTMPSSVPPPVTLNQLADVPDAPPFVSPAFTPKTVPKLDIEVPKVGGLAEMRTSARRPSGKSPGLGGEGTVNFTEIAALTRGYNVSLEQLETKLAKQGGWSADTLEPLVDELEELSRRREDLGLYKNALPAEERSQLASRQPLDQAVRLMGKRIAETRQQLESSSQAATSNVTRRDLTQLDSFSHRLAGLAGGQER
jgi:hypothetical protein